MPLFKPAIDAVLTMWPPSPWARMCGRKLLIPWSTPIRLTSITQRQLSSEIASMPPPAATPALLQITWTLPNASYVACAARSTLWGSATSQPTPRTFGLNSCSSRKAESNALGSISANITFMPACAKARPSARPMPEAPPVTNAVLPLNSRMKSSSWPQCLGKVRPATLHDCAPTDSACP